ncbi:hypothetical protein ACERZ8_20775 [Tateyamaria armeniaca]|uniref:PepSY domain-containing protein n=1 Tax=Tateyamaria armeniaca TaxID=2518930 RepID=A0ABW8V1Z9_9RHOB
MMRNWLIPCLLSVVLSGPALSGPIEDSVVRQLSEQGFSRIEVSRTWLGRSRIVSRRGDLVREIILNPLTGEILRDYWRSQHGGDGPTLFNPPAGQAGGGGEDDDDYDDDDYRDDDDDDDDDDEDDGDDDNDNSGRGSGNSGGDGDDGDDD